MTESGDDEIKTALTGDGSISLISGAHGQLYHHRDGAFAEALRDYAEVALIVWRALYGDTLPPSFKVLDCCFGLGYNTFALAQALPDSISLDVTAIEIDARAVAFVPEVLNAGPYFEGLRSSGLGPEQINDLGKFQKTSFMHNGGTITVDLLQSCLRQYFRKSQITPGKVDLILHDPFSPRKMPELWSEDLFKIYFDLLNENGFILTYSSAPAVRGALLDLGFSVYRTPWLDPRFGGTLALRGRGLESHIASGKLSSRITRPTDEELQVLTRSSRVSYRDPGLNSDRDAIFAARLLEQENFRPAKSSSQ